MMEEESVRNANSPERAKIRHPNTKTSDDLIAEYTRMAFTGMSSFVKINGRGNPYVDLGDCTAADLDLLAEITIDTDVDGRGEGNQEDQGEVLRSLSRVGQAGRTPWPVQGG